TRPRPRRAGSRPPTPAPRPAVPLTLLPAAAAVTVGFTNWRPRGLTAPPGRGVWQPVTAEDRLCNRFRRLRNAGDPGADGLLGRGPAGAPAAGPPGGARPGGGRLFPVAAGRRLPPDPAPPGP